MQADLVLTAGGLVLLLVFLVFMYVWMGKTTTKQNLPQSKTDEDFQTLSDIIKNFSATKKELIYAVDKILEKYSHIEKKDESKYLHLIENICIHPHTDSKIVLKLEKTLRQKNKGFAKEIEKALSRGLSARG